MRRTALAAALAAALCAPAAAQADTLRQTTLIRTGDQFAPQPYQRWVDAANVPAVPGSVELRLEPCPLSRVPAKGCTAAGQPVYIAPARHETRRDLRFTLLHELGHQYALRTGNPTDEAFADSYAFCALKSPARRRLTMLSLAAAPDAWWRTCRALRAAIG